MAAAGAVPGINYNFSMANLERGHITLGGIRVYRVAGGTGPAVFLLHGMGASSYSWRHQVEPLAERFRVFAFDWPGYGRSDQPKGYEYSPDSYVRFLENFMDAHGVKSASLVGNSMGGLVALKTALDRPGRVDRLALVGTPVYPGNKPMLLWPTTWPVIGPVLRELLGLLGPWAVERVARSVFFDKSVVTPEMVEEYSMALRTREGRRAIADFLRSAIPDDVDAYLARYKNMSHPVLVLRGEHDEILDQSSAERFTGEVPGARAVYFKDAGHAPHEEIPGPVNEALVGFLAAAAA